MPLEPPVPSIPPRLQAWAALEMRTAGLRTVVGGLGEAGVESVPVKGVLLARELYADPVERPLSDVDLLVRPRDFLRAVRVAKRAGWRLHWDSKTLGSVNFIVDGLAHDVASSLGPPGLCAVGVDEVIARARRQTEPLGFEHWHIDLHDHLLLMAIDAFKEKIGVKPWGREDLVRLAASAGFDADRLVARAAEARLCTMLAIMADWVLEGADSAAWREVRARLDDRPLHRGYMRRFWALMRGPTTGLGAAPLAVYARMASDSPVRGGVAVALGALGTGLFAARHRSSTARRRS